MEPDPDERGEGGLFVELILDAVLFLAMAAIALGLLVFMIAMAGGL